MNWKSFENIFTPDSRETALLERIDPGTLPRHIAVIMDGNGRWANSRNLSRIEGHKAGSESVRNITETCARMGIEFLTLYAFSVENWKRPKQEVNQLMKLLRQYLQDDLPTLMKNNIRFRPLGRTKELDFHTRKLIDHAIRTTAANTGLVLNIALNYGGRTELTDAVRRIATLVSRGTLSPDEIDADCISRHLYAPDIPDPDLLIRTSGEYRVSNFLLWEIAYAEFHFTPVLWPDFREKDLFEAIIDFQKRERRFGGVTSS